MSQPSPPHREPTSTETDRYANALRTTAWLGLIVCPTLALLPPRKLDFYTVSLITATGYSANFLIRERTGQNIYQHLSPGGQRRQAIGYQQDGVISQTEQANLHRELSNAAGELQRMGKEKGSVTGEVFTQREAWKMQREKEIKEDLEEGKGLGDMITEQVWEVWNWGKPKEEDEDEG